ncbi:hypothetical protein PARHAE_00768 [Paracoccus haematequi]|uniref:Uncharacterized protein n=1 Tax=Paracoccus haematequi TaxID=2491866 RepID=A0A447IJF5_9RHOB|nr:hypothetical protein [Paracoccus haematequi]VDS07591.1 hypothetical protein PARHAE_00768 [Paracoccus haematequi]
MPTTAQILLRDFVRYTGDGKPNEPVGKPAPVGDPSSGVHNPSKRDFREAIGSVTDAADRADRQVSKGMEVLAADGLADDTALFSAAMTADGVLSVRPPAGAISLNPSGTTFPNGGVLSGAGAGKTSLVRRALGNFLRGTDLVGGRIERLTIDANRQSLGDASGHAMTFNGTSGMTLADLEVRNFGTTVSGSGGGTGVLFTSSAANAKPRYNRLMNSTIIADPTAGTTIGWIMDDTDFGLVNNVLVRNTTSGLGWAHELKTRAHFNLAYGLQAEGANVAFGLGGEQSEADGGNFNVWGLITGRNIRTGYFQSKGRGNLATGWVIDGNIPDTEGRNEVVSLGLSYLAGTNSTAQENAVIDAMGFGTRPRFAGVGGSRNFLRILAHTVGQVVGFVSGAIGNVVEVLHPGQRASVAGAITDDSGQELDGPNANVVHSPATGERIGSISGYFHDQLSRAGVTWNAEHRWRKERAKIAVQAFGTDGTADNLTGIAVSTPGQADRASIWHRIGATIAADRWEWRGFGQGEVMTLDSAALYPTRNADDAQDRGKSLGKSTNRWKALYTVLVDYGDGVVDTAGPGSPEGVVPAAPGSTYRRKGGGAATGFYVKETGGTGNTGWVAK